MALIVGLLLAAVLLFGINLWTATADWDEGTVAQVARDIYVVHLVLGAGLPDPRW